MLDSGSGLTERWKTRKSLILPAGDQDDSQAWDEVVRYYKRFIFHVIHRINVSSADFDDWASDEYRLEADINEDGMDNFLDNSSFIGLLIDSR